MAKVLIHEENDGDIHLTEGTFGLSKKTLCGKRLHSISTVSTPKLVVTCAVCEAVKKHPKCDYRLNHAKHGLICSQTTPKGNVYGYKCTLANCTIGEEEDADIDDFRLTLSEFIKQITKEMAENNWYDKPLAFNTENRFGLHWLSLYDRDDGVCMDIGTGDE